MNVNPDRHSMYECTDPIRLRFGKLPLTPEKVLEPHVDKRYGDITYRPTIYKYYKTQPLYVPCRHCANCRRKSAKQWHSRLAHQSLWQSKNFPNGHIYFVTLTFDDKYLPHHEDGSNDLELATYPFVQSLVRTLRYGVTGVYRKTYRNDFIGSYTYDFLNPLEFQYFAVGEFGDSDKGSHRFHYHLILFVHDDRIIPDYFLHDLKGNTINRLSPDCSGKRYRPSMANPEGLPLRLCYINSGVHSQIKHKVKKRLQTGKEATFQYILSQHWKYGIVSVGSCDTNGAFGYLADYCTYSIHEKENGRKPFHRQSLGLGAHYFSLWSAAIYSGVLNTMQIDPLDTNYGFITIPQYYIKKYCNDAQRIQRNLIIIPELTRKLDLKFPEKVLKCEDSFTQFSKLCQNQKLP